MLLLIAGAVGVAGIDPTWDVATESMSGSVHVSQDGRTATRVNSQGDESILGSCVTGEGTWNMRVTFPNSYRFTYIGVQQQSTQVCRWLGCTPSSWAVRADGLKSSNGVSDMKGGFQIVNGDIVTVKVSGGELSFMKNSQDMGVMFTNLPTNEPLCVATSLWSPYSAVELMWEETNNPLISPSPTPHIVAPVRWDPTTLTGNAVMSIDASGASIIRTQENENTNEAIAGTCFLGAGEWELKPTFPGSKRFTYIGLVEKDHTHGPTMCKWLGCNQYSWAVRADGYRAHAGDSGQSGGFKYDSEDTIKMVLKEGKLTYFKNGQSMGVMFMGLPQTTPLCMAVSLWSSHSSVSIMNPSPESSVDSEAAPQVKGWDPSSISDHHGLSISKDYLKVVRETADSGEMSVTGNCVLGSGIWKLRVGFPANAPDFKTYIGLNQLGTVSCKWWGCSSTSWAVIGDGHRAHDGDGKKAGGFTMADGDLITMTLEDGNLKFNSNGIEVGTMFQGLPQNRPLCLASSLHSPDSSVTILEMPKAMVAPTPAPTNQPLSEEPTEWILSTATENGRFELSKNNRAVTRVNGFGLQTISGHCAVGKGQWKVQLSAYASNHRGDIAVDYLGVQTKNNKCTWVGCNSKSWGIRSDGKKSHDGTNEIPGGFEIKSHDIIDVILDDGKLLYKKDDIVEGVEFTGLPIDEPLCFAVSLYAPTSTAEFLEPPSICEEPPTPTNGNAVVKGHWIGATARFSCEHGLVLRGSNLRRCQANGKWNGETAVCETAPCGHEPTLTHGMQVKTAKEGGNFEIVATCEPFFVLKGPKRRFCDVKTGKFDGEAPQCLRDCGNPPVPPPNGKVAATTSYAGSKATYTCDPGFKISGTTSSTVLSCLSYGVWSGTPASCKPITCPAPIKPLHSDLSVNGQSVGSVANYMCLPGWEMKGPKSSTCDVNGVWTEPPKCVHIRTCTHVYCVLQSSHHVEVRHHRGELHGHHHQCNYNSKTDQCDCICWG